MPTRRKRTNDNQAALDFGFTSCIELAPTNRWMQLSEQIPCEALGSINEKTLNKYGL